MATRLNKETTDWLNVDHSSSKKLQQAYSAYQKAQGLANEARTACEAIKTAELVAKGELSADMTPVYSHNWGRWTVAAEKVDGSIIGQRRSKGANKRTV